MEFWILFQREYREKVCSKTFILSTILGLVVILGLSFAPAIMDKIKSADKQEIIVLETSGLVTPFLDINLQDKLPNGEPEFSFQAMNADVSNWSTKKAEAIDQLLTGKISAVVEFSPPEAPGKVIWHSKKIEMGGASAKVKNVLQQMVTQERIQQSGLSSIQLTEILTPIAFETQAEGLKAATQEQQAQNMTLVYFLLFMLYFSLIVYGTYVANGVVEEKSSRVMEMMVASVRPMTMMASKIIGIGAVGLTQYFLWIGTGLGLLALKGKGVELVPGMSLQINTIEPLYLVYFGVFFILGFLLYAAMYAGIGATVSRTEDLQQAVGPMTFLVVIGFMLAMVTLTSPNNPWIVGLSYVPFFTPMVLFARIVLTSIPTPYVLLGILDLVISTILFTWIGGRLYRVCILLNGKVSLLQIGRLIRQR